MPGVWIQERYPNGPLPNQQINGPGGQWTTVLASGLDNGIAAADGYLQWDYLAYYWNGTMDMSVTHEYYAATQSVTIGDFGLFLGSYTMYFTHGNPDMTQSVNATQSKNNP